MENASASGNAYVSFYVDELLLGVPIACVQEINSQLTMTPVPSLPDFVRGVLNLRGDVVTVLDVKYVLHGQRTEIGTQTKNVMVRIGSELIGLLVDRIGDVIQGTDKRVGPTPPNLLHSHGKFYPGVIQLESELLVLLDLDEFHSHTHRQCVELRAGSTK